MMHTARLTILGFLCAGLPGMAFAQDAKAPPPPAPAPAAGQAVPESGNPNLSVATVKMDGGLRASKIIGASVTNGTNQEVGSVNDLVLDKDGHALLGVISVGSVLGVGGKLVAVPFASLHIDEAGKVTLPDGSKETLAKMPGFTYSN